MLKDYEIHADGFEGVAFFATAPNSNAAKADFYAWVLAETGKPYVGRHWADRVADNPLMAEEARISVEEMATRFGMGAPWPATPPIHYLAVRNTDHP